METQIVHGQIFIGSQSYSRSRWDMDDLYDQPVEEFVTEEPLPGRRGGPSRTGGAYNVNISVRSPQTKALASLRKGFESLDLSRENQRRLYKQAHTYLENCKELQTINSLVMAHVVQYLDQAGYDPQSSQEPRLDFDSNMEDHIRKIILTYFPNGLDDKTRATRDFISTFQRYANLYHKYAHGINSEEAIQAYDINHSD
jgi:hypothetical protein